MTQEPTNNRFVERGTPHDAAIETALIGAVLIDATVAPRLAWLTPEHFYTERPRIAWEAIRGLLANGQAADLLTVGDWLEWHTPQLYWEMVDWLMTAPQAVTTSANAEDHARIILKHAQARDLIRLAGEIAGMAYQGKVDEAVGLSMQRLARMEANTAVDRTKTYRQWLAEARADAEQRQAGNAPVIRTGFADIDSWLGGFEPGQLILIAGRPGSGKCLSGNMLIDDPQTGERLTIADYVQHMRPQVIGISETGALRSTAVTAWMDNGIKPCFRVTTRNGRSIDVTAEHPLLTVQGWQKLSELQVGDGIAVPTSIPVFGRDESLPLDIVRLLGYYLAEGSCTKASPGFTNADPEIVADFKGIIGRHFPSLKIREERGITFYASHTRTKGTPFTMWQNPVRELLTEHGLYGKLATGKRFPSIAWKWPKAYLAEFIRAVMSCDGSIYMKSGRPYIEFGVASPEFAQDMHHALLRFGIISKYNKCAKNAWRVMIFEAASCQRYQQEIGWIGEKTRRFTDHVWKIEPRLSNVGHVPKAIWPILTAAATAQGISLNRLAFNVGETIHIGHSTGYNTHKERTLPRYRLAAYAEALDNLHLRTLSSPDIYWDIITSIEPIGDQQVYDITVPDGSNFIAQDIIVHNSALGLALARRIAGRFQHLGQGGSVDIVTMEMSAISQARRLLSLRAEGTFTTGDMRRGFRNDYNDVDLIGWARFLKSLDQEAHDAGDSLYIREDVVSTEQLHLHVLRAKQERGLKVLVIDQLNLMSDEHKDETQRIGRISTALKRLAMRHGIVVICLTQLNREVEKRQDHRPQLADLRQSGELEQNADIVLGLYRPAYYNPPEEHDPPAYAEYAELLGLKARDEEANVSLVLRFIPSAASFTDWTFEGDIESVVTAKEGNEGRKSA